VRRLRLGVSLYKKDGESWTVDLSSLKHKTRYLSPIHSMLRPPIRSLLRSATGSRFYGPTIHTLPVAIQPWVEEWVALTEFDMPPEKPYLFSMATDWERGHSSSSWTALVKATFMRHAGIACPPKVRLLAASSSYCSKAPSPRHSHRKNTFPSPCSFSGPASVPSCAHTKRE
jgi:hypothetical protein